MRFRPVLTGLIAATAALSVGCASTIAGTPQPGLAPVDVAALKTGAYTPEPSAYDPDITMINELRMVEARRLLGYLVAQTEIDPEISDAGPVDLFVNGDSIVSETTFPETYKAAANENNLLLGVYSSRTNGKLRELKKLIISVLRFPTDAESRRAAEQFDQVTNEPRDRHPIPIPSQSDAKVSSRDDITAIGFVAHGPYVIMVNAGLPTPDRDALATFVGTTIERQKARLDETTPTPLDDVLDLPLDPDSIMWRALPEAPDYSDPFIGDDDFGVYSPQGHLHYERNPAEMSKAFDEAGVDLVARRAGIVYRARDLQGAFQVQTALMQAGKNDEELPVPPGLPDARCLKLDTMMTSRLYDAFCTVVFGRYVAVVLAKANMSGRVGEVLYQRAAAQYAILAKSE
ncbi:hypothetical protein IU433_18850 [Nocardia puris]|uniref:PknH-like protein n=1 Tax=Nocardia puris TaxID=208602 RepID=A0A366DFU2_9NOCA|nr:hypothetical protein [Nocardia puris]MBF6212506.1 hypothetical protein [Nocardia puris]MBF6366753.1 hypothetical protein [Nocardia puris]MBF6461095.1 hypothetical protein [Nocardia puris]RBO88866.1 hypothetical protein DFR74_10891 [Nocardia puris]